MKLITEKKIWQKIAIILVFIILFEFVFTSRRVHADDKDENTLLEPVVGLFVSLGDSAMALIQQILLQNTGGESLIKIDDGDAGFWSKIIVAGVFIVGTALAVISAIPTGGTSVIGWVAVAGSIALKLTVSSGVYVISHSWLEKIYADMFGKTYYLPMYEVSPYEIFANKVLLFDVNFFDPKEDKVDESVIEKTVKIQSSDYRISYSLYGINGNPDNEGDKYDEIGDGSRQDGGNSNSDIYADTPEHIMEDYAKKKNITVKETKVIKEETKKSDTYVKDENADNGVMGSYITEKIVQFKCSNNMEYEILYTVKYYNGWTSKDTNIKGKMTVQEGEKSIEQSTARQLQSTVASWYLALRNIALVALLSVLVYIGIRIMLSSIASDKAKYKQMLVDWAVAICLIFLMHYLMSFSVIIVNKITEAVSSITMTSAKTNDLKEKIGNAKEYKDAVELFEFVSKKSDGGDDAKRVENAWKVLVADKKDEVSISKNAYTNYFFTDEKFSGHPTKEDGSDAKVFVWPANNFMEQARMNLQLLRGGGSSEYKYESFGYAIIFVVLIIYTVIFAFTYLKRVIYMAFLTIIAPLVAMTYPIDKINDGQAQAFNMWLKEYIFNLLIQPLHLILYLVLIGSAMNFAAKNIFYVVLALGFFTPAEKLLRRFFGFEKAQTPGMFGGPAGAGIMMAGLNRLMRPKPPKGSMGSGEGDQEEKEDNGKISTYDDKTIDFDEPLNGLYENPSSFEQVTPEKIDAPAINLRDRLNPEQLSELDKLEKDGKGPNSPEYADALRRFGINPEGENISNNTSINIPNDLSTIRMENNTPKVNTKNKRKRSIIRGFTHGVGAYNKGMKRKLQQRYKAKGGLAKRGIRMAGGLAGAATLAVAGGIVGITSGDLTKGLQYMGAGALGGYKLGSTGVEKATEAVKVNGTIKEAKQAYWGDEYDKKEQEKNKKKIAKDEEFIKKIESKFNLERKDAKVKAEELANYTDKKGIQSVDDLVKIGLLLQDGKYSKDDIIKAIGYNNLALDGKNTNKMSSEEYEKHKQRYKDRLKNNNIDDKTADDSAVKIFDIMDKANKL